MSTMDEENDPIILDEEQLQEYKEMVEELGAFAVSHPAIKKCF